MKLPVVLLVSSLSLAACGKANDLPAMKAEAEGIAKSYQVRFEELARRADAILQRGSAIGVTSPDAANASRAFAAAKTKLTGPCPDKSFVCDVRGQTAAAPTEINEIVTAKEPAEARRLKLRKYIDTKSRDWRDSYIEINDTFNAVETWITIAESRTKQVPRNDPPPPIVPPPADTPVPPPGNPGQHGAGGTTPPPSR